MIKSYAKINLHLGVLGKLSNNFHKIETLVCFSDLHDKLYVKKSNYKNHQIKFNGKFASDINKNSTIHKLLKILDKTKLLDGKKFDINITKNIPIKSGMGGGSMNAATLLNYLIKILKLKLKRKQIEEICNSIGSDVILGINRKPKVILGNNQIKNLKKKIRFHIVLLKPKFGCKTSRIYKNLNKFSYPLFNLKNFKKDNFNEFRNDLEISAFKIYPSLLKIKKEMEKLQNIYFARMTGSGSVIIAYFLRKKDAMTGTKYLKKKYKNYWCILSKTI